MLQAFLTLPMNKFITKDGNLRYQSIKALLTQTNELWKKVNQIAEECGLTNPEFKKEEWLKEVSKIHNTNDIINLVCKHFEVPYDKIKPKTRKGEIVEARLAIYYLLKRYTTLSFKGIAAALGNKDHSTAISGLKRFSAIYDTYEPFRQKMDTIINIMEQEKAKHETKQNANGTP